MKPKKDIVPLVREGRSLEITETVAATLREKTRNRLNEEKPRIGAESFQPSSIPNTKGTVEELIATLEDFQFKHTKTGPGAKNEFGPTTLYHFFNEETNRHFRVHRLEKEGGVGEHVGWAHVKMSEGLRAEIGKRGTGSTSLKSYLQKLEASKVRK